MTALEARRRLLLAESEFNRARLVADLAALAACVRAQRDRAGSLAAVASSAVTLAGMLSGRGGRPTAARPGRSWLEVIVTGGALLTRLWGSLRPR